MDSRESFEAWASDNGDYPGVLEQTDGGGYLVLSTALKWVAWQAATERAAKLCDDMVLYTGYDCAAAIRS